jgi:hypothetical protein
MRAAIRFLLACLVISLFIIGQVGAITITDLEPNDKNKITNPPGEVTDPDEFTVKEEYGEEYLIPYPSHDGFGIVNRDRRYFDKVVDEEAAGGDWVFYFEVHNTSPYCWSDYHFEFWDEDFNNPIRINLRI